jgi:Ca2+-binding RTX toxin-like protein
LRAYYFTADLAYIDKLMSYNDYNNDEEQDELAGYFDSLQLYGGEYVDDPNDCDLLIKYGSNWYDVAVVIGGREDLDFVYDYGDGNVFSHSTIQGLVNLTGGQGEGEGEGDFRQYYGDGDDRITGSEEEDIIFAGGGNDTIHGLSGNDSIFGDDGNDILRGGGGSDQLDGGEGRDTADYRDSGSAITVDLSIGAVSGGTGQGDTLFSIENIYGSAYSDTLMGNAEANTLLGYGGDDVLSGDEGNDNLQGSDGLDTHYGGLGNDVLRGGTGADLLDGGEGRDSADYRDSSSAVAVDLVSGTAIGGTAEGDTLLSIENVYGTEYNDTLVGNAEANTLLGYSGDDILFGNAGNDNLQGGEGQDELYGGLDNDTFRGGAGADILDGGEGRDSADYRDSSSAVAVDLTAGTAIGGIAEGDTLLSIENVYGTGYNDIFIGNAEANTLLGYNGDDVLSGNEGNDNLQGGNGQDELYGGLDNDTLRGGAGADILDGGEGRDSADYRDSSSAVAVDLTAGTASGGTAEGDTPVSIENVYGTEYNDIFIGNAEANTLLGYNGDDMLFGNEGNDNLQGGDGQDELYGGLGKDTLSGGLGNDTFIFDSVLSATTNKDTITDFNASEDKITLHNVIFNALIEEGTLSAVNFHAGSTGMAADDNDYILYNTTTGALLYDADGSGQGVAVEFAVLSTKPQINENNFVIASL